MDDEDEDAADESEPAHFAGGCLACVSISNSILRANKSA